MDQTFSVNSRPIRLTAERWLHIVENHQEMAGLYHEVLEVVMRPDKVYEGDRGALIAVKQWRKGKYIIVVYRELLVDGFIITAFLSKRVRSLERRRLVWPISH